LAQISRGQAVNQVVVIGVEFERSRLFANAIAAALPQAKVKLLPEESESQDADRKTPSGRAASLAACRAQGPFQLDLTVHLQARHAYVFTLAACLLLVTGGVGVVAHQSMSRRLQTILENQRVLQGQASDLEDLRERNAAADAALERAMAECERMLEAGELGVPLASALEGALLAVGPKGELTSFVADRDRYGGQVALAGLTDADPLSSMRVLAGMQGALERSPLFENVELEAPTLAIDQDGTLGSAGALEFEIAATWEGSAP
jgi:hypothetical protein